LDEIRCVEIEVCQVGTLIVRLAELLQQLL